MLLQQRQPVEAGARHLDKEVVAPTGPVGDADHHRFRKRVVQQPFEVVGHWHEGSGRVRFGVLPTFFRASMMRGMANDPILNRDEALEAVWTLTDILEEIRRLLSGEEEED